MKTVEELINERIELENTIQNAINIFARNNPYINFDIEYSTTSVRFNDEHKTITDRKIEIKITL